MSGFFSTSSPETKPAIKNGRIKIMDKVLLEDRREGTVLYIGKLHNKSEDVEYIGLELSKGTGNNNGILDDIQYFACPQGTGLFVKPEKVKKIISSDLSFKRGFVKPIDTSGRKPLEKTRTRNSKLKTFPPNSNVMFSFGNQWYPAVILKHNGREFVNLKVISNKQTKECRLDNQTYEVHVNRLRKKSEALPDLNRKLNKRGVKSSKKNEKECTRTETPLATNVVIYPNKQKNHHRNWENISSPAIMRKNSKSEISSSSSSSKRAPDLSAIENKRKRNSERARSVKRNSRPDPPKRIARHEKVSESSDEDSESERQGPAHPFGDHPAVQDLQEAKRLRKEGDISSALAIFQDVICEFQEAISDVKSMNEKNKRRTYLAKLRRHVDNLIAGSSSNKLPNYSNSNNKSQSKNSSKRKRNLDEPVYFERPKPKAKPVSEVKSKNSRERRKKNNLSEQDKQFRKRLSSDLVTEAPGIHFADVQGLLMCKLSLYEAVILPAINPHIFTGLRKPPKGILLFGPPGNGKTMIAKAVATECDHTFFGISASTITSKFVGESERLMRNLFDLAREQGPSIIFIDELDSLLRTRGSSNENEGSRRLKTEFLVQFDGIHTENEDPSKRVLVMGATNLPHELDDAVLRRFQKRIPVPMPNNQTRKHIITKLLDGCNSDISTKELDFLVQHTNDYSCSDLSQLTSEAAMGPIRDAGSMAKSISVASLAPLSHRHFETALQYVKPSVPEATVKACDKWAEQYGSSNTLSIRDLPEYMVSEVEKETYLRN